MDGRALTVAEVERIADLESREVLLAKLAGAMKGNLAKAAGLFNAPASQVARLAAALQEKKARAQPQRDARRPPKHQPNQLSSTSHSRITADTTTETTKIRKDPHHGKAVH